MSNQDLLNKINQISGVQGALIATKDGQVKESSLPESTDPAMIGMVVSSVFSHIEVQSKRMQRGEPKKIIIETDSQVISVTVVESGMDSILIFGEFGKDIDIENLYNSIS